MATIDGWLFYKIKTQGRMTPENINSTCLNYAMKPACYCNNGCKHADSGCTQTLNTTIYPDRTQEVISKVVCGNKKYRDCEILNNVFVYMVDFDGDSWGVEDGNWRRTKTILNLWSLCTIRQYE